MRISALSYAFPPLAFPRSVQVSRLLGALPDNVTVFCAEDPEAPRDETIPVPGVAEGRVEIVRVPRPRKSFAARGTDYVLYKSGFSWLKAPDFYRIWSFSAAEKIKDFTAKNRPADIFITFGEPMSAHLAALSVKKEFPSIKWIVHLSDPWADNPYRDGGRLGFTLNCALEKKVFAAADLILFTAEEAMASARRRHAGLIDGKSGVLHHCYDTAVFGAVPKAESRSGRYLIRYMGEFYGRRTPLEFLRALDKIAREEPSLMSGVEFEIIGASSARVSGFSARYPCASKFVRFLPRVPYLESVKMMKEADCLLILDAPYKESPFFPSKLVDYIGSGSFILTLSPPGAAARITEETGGRSFNVADGPAVIGGLRELFEKRPRARSVASAASGRYDVAFAARKMTEYMETLKQAPSQPA